MNIIEVKNKIGQENWDKFVIFIRGQTVGFDKGIVDFYECDVNKFMSIIK